MRNARARSARKAALLASVAFVLEPTGVFLKAPSAQAACSPGPGANTVTCTGSSGAFVSTDTPLTVNNAGTVTTMTLGQAGVAGQYEVFNTGSLQQGLILLGDGTSFVVNFPAAVIKRELESPTRVFKSIMPGALGRQ